MTPDRELPSSLTALGCLVVVVPDLDGRTGRHRVMGFSRAGLWQFASPWYATRAEAAAERRRYIKSHREQVEATERRAARRAGKGKP